MSYRIAGIDVHKKMLALVVSDVEVDGEYQFERVRYNSTPEHLRLLAQWLMTQQVEEVVMDPGRLPDIGAPGRVGGRRANTT